MFILQVDVWKHVYVCICFPLLCYFPARSMTVWNQQQSRNSKLISFDHHCHAQQLTQVYIDKWRTNCTASKKSSVNDFNCPKKYVALY